MLGVKYGEIVAVLILFLSPIGSMGVPVSL